MLSIRSDLHVHSRCSDGSWPPERVAETADMLGLGAVALADHDTIAGIPVMRRVLAELDSPCDLITAAELTCYDEATSEFHILAYGFDETNPAIQQSLDTFAENRRNRLEEMLQKLQALGVPVTAEDVARICGDGVPGRVHLAKALRRNNVVESVQQAFDRYLVKGAPAWVPKKNISPQHMIELIHSWGALAVLAHPYYTDNPESMAEHFVAMGIDGFEAYHPRIDKKLKKHLKKLALKHDLVISGGSDFHGPSYNHAGIGEVHAPYVYVQALQERIAAQGIPN